MSSARGATIQALSGGLSFMASARSRIVIAALFLCAAAFAVAQDSPFGQNGPAPAGKQQAAPPAQPAQVPDTVCFGNSPRWSFQFGSQAARTLGISEGDKWWIGKFTYVDGQWSWHGNPASGSGSGLTATIYQREVHRQNPGRYQRVSVSRAGVSAGRQHRERLLPQAEAGRSAGRPARVRSQHTSSAVGLNQF